MQPHPILTDHYRSVEEKQRFLRNVFDQSAPHYERIIRWGSFGTGEWYRRQALLRAGLRPGMRVLDVATGTGPTARAAASIVGGARQLVCVDPSIGMLHESQKRLATAYVQAGADHLPLRNERFDFLAMGYALRHVESLEGAFREYFRVLKPGGKLLLLEITNPNNRFGQVLARFYFRDILPWLTRWFTGSRQAGEMMVYYWETVDQMVRPAQVLEAMSAVGFSNVSRRVVWGVFSEYESTKP